MSAASADGRGPVSGETLAGQLRELGVERGDVLVVHSSYRAIRPIEGGIEGLIEGLRAALGPEGTLVMPAWSSADDVPFDPETSPSDPDLGAVPHVFWQLPGVQRTRHAFAFAAIGPQAEAVLQDDLPMPPHGPASPVGRVHELDGKVLLLGVNHDANTTVHLAEVIARVPYGLPKYCTVRRDGRPARIDYVENDHCCGRFRLVDDWLAEPDLQATGPLGHGEARLTRSRDVVERVLLRLQQDVLLFLHGPAEGCQDCDAARASVGQVASGSRHLRGSDI